MDYTFLRRLEQAVLFTAKQHGYTGQPFAEVPMPLGTEREEWAAVALSLHVSPRPATAEAKRLVRVWTRNIVLSTNEEAEAAAKHTAKKVRAW